MMITYGIRVDSAEDSYISHAEKTLHAIDRAIVPGSYIVDILPILKHLPRNTPFIQFHKHGAEGRKLMDKLRNAPFQHVISEINKGQSRASFTRDMLVKESLDEPTKDTIGVGNLNLTRESMEAINWTSGTMYGAASETTYGTLMTFFLAITLNPEVQKKAQKELDSVLTASRSSFPSYDHKPQLPYLQAVLKEVMRWRPVFPLGIARRTDRDDWYNGSFIPRGTTVMPNVWSIAMAPGSKYPVDEFRPQRFLDPDEDVLDPRSYAFGFGSRVCPGQGLAENTIFIVAASLLSCFSFLPPIDKEGNEVPIEPKFPTGLQISSYVRPFPCRIKPRSPSKVDAISERVLHSTM